MRFTTGIGSQDRQKAVTSVGGVPSNFYPTDWRQPGSDWQRSVFGGNATRTGNAYSRQPAVRQDQSAGSAAGPMPPAPSGGVDMSAYRPSQAQAKISSGNPATPRRAETTQPQDSGIRFPVIRENPGRNDEPIRQPSGGMNFFPVPDQSNSGGMQQLFEQAARGGVSSEIVQQAINNNQRMIPVTQPGSLARPAGGFIDSPGFRESDYRRANSPKFVPNPFYQNPDVVLRPTDSPQQPASPSPSVIESGPMRGMPEGTKIIRGPQGGFVFPESPPPMFTQQPNGGYRPDVSQQPSLPPGFVPGRHAFSVMQTPGVSSAPPQLPAPGFTAQYRNFDGSVSDSPNYAQRDAFVQSLNDALLPYQTGRASGAPTYDFPALLSQANEMVDAGYQNPFAFQNPLAGLFG